MNSSLQASLISLLMIGLCYGRQIAPDEDNSFEYDPQCEITLKWKGIVIPNGADVKAYIGSDVDVECTAYCTGTGVSPAFEWRRNGTKVSTNVGRVYHYPTTFERRSVLHIGDMGTYDQAKYKCKGWIKGIGWKSKSFNLIKGCPKGFEECDSHRCINSSRVCDGVFDCQDGTDEKECVKCKDDEFECDDRCNPNRWRCDYIQHCSDGFDELNCEHSDNCSESQFLCGSGECIDGSYKCDKYPDCEDKSDELGCPQCSVGQFPCDDGECIQASYACDGYPDCLDMSDETQCGADVVEEAENCTDEDFRCGSGGCVKRDDVCDGFDDCDDASDETNCATSSTNLPTVAVTGGTDDIDIPTTPAVTEGTTSSPRQTGSSTTRSTTAACESGQLQCLDGVCISENQWCDDHVDCVDFSDELECGLTTQEVVPYCGTGEFMCNTGECISMSQRCDSQPDCAGEEDESECEGTSVCSEGKRLCEDGRGCYSQDQICNAAQDCEDGSDEKNCYIN